jgi:hypothetical protein
MSEFDARDMTVAAGTRAAAAGEQEGLAERLKSVGAELTR